MSTDLSIMFREVGLAKEGRVLYCWF